MCIKIVIWLKKKTAIAGNNFFPQGNVPLSPVVVYVKTSTGALLNHYHHQAHFENK
jgi:predicted RNA binding protein with dsRBD fold (UPF0201 family)